MFRAHFSRAEGEAAAPVAVQVTILRDTLGILVVPTIPIPFPPSPFTHPRSRSGTVMLVRATASLQALVSIPLLDAKLKIRASGLMLGFMQTSASSSDASSSSSLALLAPKSSKFVLRFTARADLLTFVAALRDAGARVNGDAAAHQKAEPVDVKPALDLSSSQLFASSQLSQSASCTGTGTGGVGVAAANPAVVGKRKAASDELALPTPAFARMSSMSSSYHQHSSQSTQTAARRERDENAPTNQFAAPPPLSLLQRVAAVMAAPDFEAQVASVERALSILRQSSV
jgi:hypothetical protein